MTTKMKLPPKCEACDGYGSRSDMDVIGQDYLKQDVWRHKDPFDCIRELKSTLEAHNL